VIPGAAGYGHVARITRDTWNDHHAVDVGTRMLTRLLTLVAVVVRFEAIEWDEYGPDEGLNQGRLIAN
jgi:hypothetical protein